MQKRTLCFWLPRWPLERLAAARPELKGRPLLLYTPIRGGLRVVAVEVPSPKSKVVNLKSQVSSLKPPTGIRPGIPLAEALALYEHAWAGIETTSALHVEAHDPTADRLALEELAQWCHRFSPLIAIEDAPRPECLILDISGLGRLFGDEGRLTQLVTQELTSRGLTVRVAVADALGAAWALAHFASRSEPCIVPPGQNLQALAPLPLAALRLPTPTIEMFAELGVRSVGQLVALPRCTLLARFGAEPLRRIDQALAAARETPIVQKPVEPMVAERTFEHPTDRRALVEFVLEQLLAELSATLAGQRRGVLRLACRLKRQEAAPIQFEVGLFRPSSAPRHLLDLVRLRLESLRFHASRNSPVEAVQITVVASGPLAEEQQELFGATCSREQPRHVAALVDRLANRLGRENVVRPCLLADAQPEFACQYLPLDDQSRFMASTGKAKGKGRSRPALIGTTPEKTPGERPLRLLSPPQPLDATSIIPDGPPLQFRFQGRHERVELTWGPERIETGWWRGRCVRRDYYRVETSTGSRYWLFRLLQDGRWFLHGEFA